jgi:hypothetical protein
MLDITSPDMEKCEYKDTELSGQFQMVVDNFLSG